jgi:four helix bundle protein
MAGSFKDLRVWQRSIELSPAIYRLTAHFPDSEKFGLTNQMRRASVSISSNIAEGAGRTTTGEFVLFLGNAQGSCFELQSQLVIVKGLELTTATKQEELESLCNEIGRLLALLIKSLKANPPRPRSR